MIGLLSITFGNDFEIPSLKERDAVTLEQSALEKYVGTYSSPNFPLDIELFVDGGNLMAQATGQGAFPLTVYNKNTMTFAPAGIELKFEEPENSRYNGFLFSQAGQQFKFELKEDSE